MGAISKAYEAFLKQGMGNYPGHDLFQNGVLSRSNGRIYIAGWSENWAQSGNASGFFTDQATIDSCKTNGVLDTNKLDALLQTKLSNYEVDAQGNLTTGDVYRAHSDVSAYDIHYDNLDALKDTNPDLYNRLTNGDGEIQVAYGDANANVQNGSGGGHQYYWDEETFQEAIDNGVIEYNEGASYSATNDALNPIARTDYSAEAYEDYYDATYADVSLDEEIAAEERKALGISDEEYANSCTIEGEDYIAEPDPYYVYVEEDAEELVTVEETTEITVEETTEVEVEETEDAEELTVTETETTTVTTELTVETTTNGGSDGPNEDNGESMDL